MRDDLENTEGEGRGVRYSAGKLPFRLVPWDGFIEVVEVFKMGGSKYAPRNWENGLSYESTFDSLMRHAIAWYLGEDNDWESGLHHMAHVAWNALVLVTYHMRGMVHLDDRGCREGDGNTTKEVKRWRGLRHLPGSSGGSTSSNPSAEETATQE